MNIFLTFHKIIDYNKLNKKIINIKNIKNININN